LNTLSFYYTERTVVQHNKQPGAHQHAIQIMQDGHLPTSQAGGSMSHRKGADASQKGIFPSGPFSHIIFCFGLSDTTSRSVLSAGRRCNMQKLCHRTCLSVPNTVITVAAVASSLVAILSHLEMISRSRGLLEMHQKKKQQESAWCDTITARVSGRLGPNGLVPSSGDGFRGRLLVTLEDLRIGKGKSVI
jgi:hypothetical protein